MTTTPTTGEALEVSYVYEPAAPNGDRSSLLIHQGTKALAMLFGHQADAVYALLNTRPTPPAPDEFTLLGVLADIRHKTGIGHKPMLSELADVLAGMTRPAHEAVEKMVGEMELAEKLCPEDAPQTLQHIRAALAAIGRRKGE